MRSVLLRSLWQPFRRSMSKTVAMEKDFKVEKKGSCVVVRLCLGENRLNPNFIRAYNAVLDKVESYEDAKCMVTIGEGKHYSLGLDLDLMATMHLMEILEFSYNFQLLLARMLTFPVVSVAAINGHIYAAGAFLAFAQDYSVMRTDRGWFCLPEVKIKRNFTAGFLELAKARLPLSVQHECIILGRKYTADEAKAAGIVNEVSSLEKLEENAIAAAKRIVGEEGLDRNVLSALKNDMYRDVIRVLKEPSRFYSNL